MRHTPVVNANSSDAWRAPFHAGAGLSGGGRPLRRRASLARFFVGVGAILAGCSDGLTCRCEGPTCAGDVGVGAVVRDGQPGASTPADLRLRSADQRSQDGGRDSVAGRPAPDLQPADLQSGQDGMVAWRELPSMNQARGYFCGVHHLGKIYVFGGISRSSRLQFASPVGTAEVYDMGTKSWSKISSLPHPRSATGCGVISNRVVVAGGRYWGNTSTVQVYDIATDTWKTGASMSESRGWPAAAVHGGKLYVLGGVGYVYSKTAERYDLTNNKWTPAGSLVTGRYLLGAASFPGGVVTMGGDSWGTGKQVVYDHIEIYSPANNAWKVMGKLPKPMTYTSVINHKGKLYMIYNGKDVYRVNTASWSLTKVLALPPAHSHGPVIVSTPMGIVLAGGGGWGPNTAAVHLLVSLP